MKALIIVKCLDCNGGVAHYYKTLKLNKSEDIEYYIPKVKLYSIFKIFSFIGIYIRFFKLVKKHDIILVNPSLGKTAIIRDLLFLLIAKRLNKKAVVFFRGWDENLENRIKNSRLLNKIFLKYNKADAFFILGDIFKKKLINLGISKNKQFYLETTIADNRFISDFNIKERISNFNNEQKPIKFLFISRISAGKGMKLAIDIFNKVQKKNTRKMQLIFAGNGDKLLETKQYVTENNINNIVFKGYVRDREKHNILKDSDVFIMTSESEGLPNSVLEGMLYGLPIITTNVGSVSEWVKNNENGFVAESTNSNDFVTFINNLIVNKELYTKIARNNHKIAIENFTKEVVTKRFLEHYKTVYNEE